MSWVPQLPQKWAFSGLSAWHFAHFITNLSPQIKGKRVSIHEKKSNISILHIGLVIGYNIYKSLIPDEKENLGK